MNAWVQHKKVRKTLVKHWRLFSLVLVLLSAAVVTFYRGLEKSRRLENAQKRGPEATVDALFESGFSGDMSAIFLAPESPDRVLAPFRQGFRTQFPSQPPGSYKERTPRTFQFTLHEMKLLQYDGTEARVKVSGEAVPDPVKGSEGGAGVEYVWCPPCRFFFSVDVLLTLKADKWFVVGMENIRVP